MKVHYYKVQLIRLVVYPGDWGYFLLGYPMTRPNSRGCISSCKVPLVQSLHPFSVKRKTPGSAKVKQVLVDVSPNSWAKWMTSGSAEQSRRNCIIMFENIILGTRNWETGSLVLLQRETKYILEISTVEMGDANNIQSFR